MPKKQEDYLLEEYFRNDDEVIIEEFKSARQRIKYFVQEWTLEVIKTKWENGTYYKPSYQRQEGRWTIEDKSYYIESLIIGLPIPYLFGASDENERTEIVDGLQRITTAIDFLNDKFKLITNDKGGLSLLTKLDKKYFSDLPKAIQNRLYKTVLRVVELEGTITENGADYSARFEVFRRINTTGTQLSDMELRNGLFQKTKDFLLNLSKNEMYFNICKKHISNEFKKKGEAEELILRFIAYSIDIENYKNKPADFLTKYAEKLNIELNNEIKDKINKEFSQMLNFVEKYMPNSFLVPKTKRISRSRFTAISVGVIFALRESPNLILEHDFSNDNIYNKWVKSDGANSKLKLCINHVYCKLLSRVSVIELKENEKR